MEHAHQQLSRVLEVVHDEDLAAGQIDGGVSDRRAPVHGQCAGRNRQANAEPRAESLALAVRMNLTAVKFDEVTRDGQTESEAAVPPCRSAVALPEAVEDEWQQLGSDTRSGVFDVNHQPVAAHAASHRNGPLLGRELDRVRDHIAEYLLQPARIALDRRQVVGDLACHLNLLQRGLREQAAQGGFDQSREVQRLRLDRQLAGDDPRHVEDVFDQLGLQLRIAADDVDRMTHAIRRMDIAFQHVNPAEDGVERRAQFVGERGQKLILQLVGLVRVGEPGEFGLFAPRHRYADSRHSHRLTVRVLDAPLALHPAHASITADDAILDVIAACHRRSPTGSRSARAARSSW